MVIVRSFLLWWPFHGEEFMVAGSFVQVTGVDGDRGAKIREKKPEYLFFCKRHPKLRPLLRPHLKVRVLLAALVSSIAEANS